MTDEERKKYQDELTGRRITRPMTLEERKQADLYMQEGKTRTIKNKRRHQKR